MILVHPLIDPIILSFGFVQIRWYSMAYILGFFIGLFLVKNINNNFSSSLKKKLIDDFFIWAVIGVIIGGRLGYTIFYQLESTINNPISVFYIWQGGMSFHGGLLGIIISIFIYSKFKRIKFFQLSDQISIVAPIGIFLGRLANFINVELYGRITEFPFAMIYPNIDNMPRHPSQIYEAFFEGIVLFIILNFLYKKSIYRPGITSSLFLIFYSIFRFTIEFLREPDAQIGLVYSNMTMGQIISILTIMIGLILIYFLKDVKK